MPCDRTAARPYSGSRCSQRRWSRGSPFAGFGEDLRRNFLISALVLLLSFVVLAGPAEASRVAVLLSAKVSEYEDALKGFRESTPHQIVALFDMDRDLDRGRKQLAEIQEKLKPDLIFAVGIWALQAVVNRPPVIPVVYARVLNPPSVLGAA